MHKRLNVLLINPYIYDVSAYGFWSAPLGLLYMGAILRKGGAKVTLLDCLVEQEEKRKPDGRAPFLKEKVESPEVARNLKKKFRRYGMSQEEVAGRLAVMEKPDVVLITCVMTYWYQGAKEIVKLVRENFPNCIIAVGGVYAALCEDHAKRVMSDADIIVGRDGLDQFYTMIENAQGYDLSTRPGRDDIVDFPYPAFDLYRKRTYVPILTSVGCVYHCTYCATPYLRSAIIRREHRNVLRELMYWNGKDITRFALYDDGFLTDPETFAKPLLLGVSRLPFDVSFYNPNAMNAAFVDQELAVLLRAARFQEVRLGLETADPQLQRGTGGKVTRKVFERAVGHLLNAGFSRNVIQAYIMAGLPLQRWEDVKDTVDFAVSLGIKVNLAEYTPIPHSVMFDQYKHLARYPIEDEPLFQNNALFPFAWEGFTDQDMSSMKSYVREKNAANTVAAVQSFSRTA
jgi:radical SAM superfamily enzyme YgiQ (UPF0313 family)